MRHFLEDLVIVVLADTTRVLTLHFLPSTKNARVINRRTMELRENDNYYAFSLGRISYLNGFFPQASISYR